MITYIMSAFEIILYILFGILLLYIQHFKLLKEKKKREEIKSKNDKLVNNLVEELTDDFTPSKLKYNNFIIQDFVENNIILFSAHGQKIKAEIDNAEFREIYDSNSDVIDNIEL